MNGYFLTLIILLVLGIGINIAKDGEPKEGYYNYIVAIISSLIEIALIYMAIKVGF